MTKRYAIRIQDRNGFERRVPLGNVTLFGRRGQCDIVLADEMISRLHLKVEFIDGQYWAEDLDSSHGTYQDGERIKRVQWKQKTPLVLADGAYRLTLVPGLPKATESNMHAILSTAQQLSGEFDLGCLLQKSLDHLLRLSGQDRGFIMIDEGGGLEILAERNLMPGQGQTLSMSSAWSVFDTGEAIWLADTSTNETIRSQKSVIDMQLKTIFCMPLSVDGKNIGVVYLDSRYVRQDPIDRNSFEAIVGLCAVAIERARFSEKGRRRRAVFSASPLASNQANDFNDTLLQIDGHAELLFNLCSGSEAKFHIGQIQSAVARLGAMGSQIFKKKAAKGTVKGRASKGGASNSASSQTAKKKAAKGAVRGRVSKGGALQGKEPSSAKGKH